MIKERKSNMSKSYCSSVSNDIYRMRSLGLPVQQKNENKFFKMIASSFLFLGNHVK